MFVPLPVLVQAQSNAFYIVDSPIPIILQCDVGGTSAYASQTGESFPQRIKSLNIIGVASNFKAGITNTASLLTVKIWVGFDSHVGFIDHRVCWDTSDYEVIQPGRGVLSMAAGGNNVSLSLPVTPPNMSALGFLTVGLMISNLDAANPVYISDPSFALYAAAVFAGQTYRLPMPFTGNTLDMIPDDLQVFNNGTLGNQDAIFIFNPGATAVNIIVARIMRTKSYFQTKTP